MIKSIAIKNWRSHLDSSISFSNGTNLIVGRMGGGKSSIIDGICFALFGTTPAVQHRRLKITDFIKNRPKEETEAQVTLVFEHKQDEYSVTRKIKRKGGSEAEIKKNGQRVEGPQSERVSDYIRNLLEIDYDLFTRAIYSEQNRIDYFLTLGRGERKRQIDELIGIDRFEVARKNATTAASRIRTMKADKESFVKNSNPALIEKEIADFEKQMSEIQAEKLKNQSEYESLSKQKTDQERIIAELKIQRERFRKLQEDITGLRHNLELLRKDVQGSGIEEGMEETEKRLNEKRSQKEALQKELSAMDNEYRELTKSLGAVKSELQTIERKKAMKKDMESGLAKLLDGEKVENIKLKMKELEERGAEASQKVSDCKAKIAELEKSITELKSADSHCPVCDSELGEEKKDSLISLKDKGAGELRKAVVDISKELAEINARLKAAKERADSIEKTSALMKEYEGIEENETSGIQKAGEIDLKLKQATAKKTDADAKLNAVNNEYVELAKLYERIKEIRAKQAKIAQIEKDLSEKEKAISPIQFNDQKWDSENSRLSDISVRYAQAKAKTEQHAEKETYVAKLVSDRKVRLDEVRKYSKEIEEYSELISSFQLFSNAVVETQHELREELIDSVNQALSEIWGRVYPYSDYTVIKLVPSENDYDLMFKVNDGYISVDGIASGGERALACLALRVAFAMVLTPNLSWLVLDEPTHNLDEEAVKTLAETLRDHIPQIVEQTFVITHEELMKEAASGKLVRIQRDPASPENSKVDELNEIKVSTPSVS